MASKTVKGTAGPFSKISCKDKIPDSAIGVSARRWQGCADGHKVDLRSWASLLGDGVGRSFHCFSRREGGALVGRAGFHNERSILASPST